MKEVFYLTLVLVFLQCYPLQAATYYVDDDTCPDTGVGTESDPFCSIQSGIEAAFPGGIVEVSPGTYFENITLMSGVEVKGAGAGNDSSVHSIIDGGENGSVVTANGVDSTAKLNGFMITNGKGTGGTGGGMFNTDSSPMVSNCIFKSNIASIMTTLGWGGGMYNSNSSPTVSNCVFSTNTSGGSGGGMYNIGSSPILTNCTFSNNTAWEFGGGMYNNNSSPTLTNTTFSANEATVGSGGGMYNISSSPTVSNSSFNNNTAYNLAGGAMFNITTSSPIVVNTIFYKNVSRDDGFEITNYSSSSPTITNCTFFSIHHPAIYNSNSSPIITNSILWGGGYDEIFNTTGSNPDVTYSNIETGPGYIEPGIGNINADPKFVDAANGDLHLQLGSPCIDAGNNSAPALPVTDIDGDDRRIDDPTVADTGNGTPPIVDIGAFEVRSSFRSSSGLPWLMLLLE